MKRRKEEGKVDAARKEEKNILSLLVGLRHD